MSLQSTPCGCGLLLHSVTIGVVSGRALWAITSVNILNSCARLVALPHGVESAQATEVNRLDAATTARHTCQDTVSRKNGSAVCRR